jgi:CO/xanthine dehydrogenase Mo-binding subunit
MSILGNRVVRTEDPRFLSGDSIYVADMKYPGAVHAVFVRSLMASATLAISRPVKPLRLQESWVYSPLPTFS